MQEWCRANAAECLAVQPPGRNLRHDEAPLTSPQALAQALFPVVASQLADVPYAVSYSPSSTHHTMPEEQLANMRHVRNAQILAMLKA